MVKRSESFSRSSSIPCAVGERRERGTGVLPEKLCDGEPTGDIAGEIAKVTGATELCARAAGGETKVTTEQARGFLLLPPRRDHRRVHRAPAVAEPVHDAAVRFHEQH